ncbi:MAG: putative nicotinamide N-methyase [Planctomycetaceae bacterium]|jgi:predicted nicotinamide N-methyase
MTAAFESLQSELQKTVSNARLEPRNIPLCPQVQLYLLNDDFPKGPLPHDEILAVMQEPAYRAFCWASGQVLARYLLGHPELCNGKTILDFGSGSGVVGMATALAGAERSESFVATLIQWHCCLIRPTLS